MNKENIAVIGGANIEYIVKSKSDIIQGSKNLVDIEELYGGSGLNYALRLLAFGASVYPLVYVGNDSCGRNIQKTLLKYCDSLSLTHKFISSGNFFIKELTTIRSIIVTHGQHRTILTEDKNSQNFFFPFLKSQISQLENISTIVIGHIHNDKAELNKDSSNLSTLFAIKYFSDDKRVIYCNFGSAQIDYGYEFWKGHLKFIDFLQLNIYEAKQFFTYDDKSPSLLFIIESLINLNISGVITLDKFGSIGFMKGKKQTIFMARPIELGDEFVDSTGAGDAYCAGMVSSLNGKNDFDEDDFSKAMEVARAWAVYACKSYGGANNCPSFDVMDKFHIKVSSNNEVLQYHDDRMIDIITLIDSTFAVQD